MVYYTEKIIKCWEIAKAFLIPCFSKSFYIKSYLFITAVELAKLVKSVWMKGLIFIKSGWLTSRSPFFLLLVFLCLELTIFFFNPLLLFMRVFILNLFNREHMVDQRYNVHSYKALHLPCPHMTSQTMSACVWNSLPVSLFS